MKERTRSNRVSGYPWLLQVVGMLAMLGMISVSMAEERVADVSAIVVEPQKSATLDEVTSRLARERVVYVGETHTAYGDHLLQLEVLRAMAAEGKDMALGVEWFQARFQPVLDAYLAGSIDEAEMLQRTDYYGRWRFDYRLYRPIIRFARDNGIPIVALNASRELTGEIRRVGIDALTGPLRDELPDGYDFTDQDYEESLRQVFRAHAMDENGDFRRFLEVQLTWDESMAQRVATYLTDRPGSRMLVLAGRGHIVGRHGIPSRVTRRTGIRGTTLMTYTPVGGAGWRVDYLVLTSEQMLPPAGLMLVSLDERDGGVYIGEFGGDSPAEAAGAEKGDRIVSINGKEITHFAQVKLALLDQPPGSEIELGVARQGLFSRERNLSLRFMLSGDMPSSHR